MYLYKDFLPSSIHILLLTAHNDLFHNKAPSMKDQVSLWMMLLIIPQGMDLLLPFPA